MKLFKGCDDDVHKYEARYDKGATEFPWDRFKTISGVLDSHLEAHREVTYVRDVCVRCGNVIERGSTVEPLRKIA